MRALLTGAWLVLLQAVAHADADWQKIATYEDLSVWVRPASTRSLREVQVRAQSPLEPADIFAVIWDVAPQREFVPFVKELSVLSTSAEEIVFYERLHVPVVHDRDYVLKLTRKIEGDHYEAFAEGHSELGPPPPKGVVRVTNLWTHILVQPRVGGGSEFWYTSFADPAGHVPSWLVRAADEHGPREFVRAVLRRAAERKH